MHYLPILSTLITLVFTIAVLTRYRRKGGVHLLLWGVGLASYGIGTLTEVIMLFTFNTLALKVWYVTGAMLTAAWLGQGTVHLLVRRRGVALSLTALLGAVSLISLGLILAAPVSGAASSFSNSLPVSAQYKEILVRSGGIKVLTILLNIYGTFTLVGGALYSAYLFWRKNILANRLIGNILIASGALLPAIAGSSLKVGLADWLYVSECLGVILMYFGFMLATSGKTVTVAKSVTV